MKSVWCSGRKSLIAWVAPSGPLPERAARADGRLALLELVAGCRCGSRLGVDERGQPLDLVAACSTVDADARAASRAPPRSPPPGSPPKTAKCGPGHADQEQDRRPGWPCRPATCPRSGCRKTMAVGSATTPAQSRREAGRARPGRSRSTTRPARTTIMITLPISEGWRLNGPRSIQRCRPAGAAADHEHHGQRRRSSPPHSAQAQRASAVEVDAAWPRIRPTTPTSDEEDLAVEEEVAGRRDVGRGRPADHVQAEGRDGRRRPSSTQSSRPTAVAHAVGEAGARPRGAGRSWSSRWPSRCRRRSGPGSNSQVGGERPAHRRRGGSAPGREFSTTTATTIFGSSSRRVAHAPRVVLRPAGSRPCRSCPPPCPAGQVAEHRGRGADASRWRAR